MITACDTFSDLHPAFLHQIHPTPRDLAFNAMLKFARPESGFFALHQKPGQAWRSACDMVGWWTNQSCLIGIPMEIAKAISEG